jgi:hypothetical protein
MAEKSPVKIKTNKDHGGKEFSSSFHFVGKVKPVRNQENGTDNWVDVPFYREEKDDNGKVKKILEFIVETAESNDLKVKMTGKEMTFAYPYSSTKGKASKIAWQDRFDKSKYPDDSYHYIDSEWDKIDKLKEIITTDAWVEVKGKYNPYEFTGNNDNEIKGVSRALSYVNPVIDGKVKIGDELKPIQVNKKDIPYICDLKSPDFVEVNNFKMQLGIRSTYKDEEKGFTKVNGVVLTYGKDRSEPKDVELLVYQQEVAEGTTSLADAFATLDELDFIEVAGQDNNRATFAWVPVEEKLEANDLFANVSSENKQVRMEKVTNGAKKGLEITGYVTGSIIRGFLTDAEVSKSVAITEDNPFMDNGKPIDISDDDLPF